MENNNFQLPKPHCKAETVLGLEAVEKKQTPSPNTHRLLTKFNITEFCHSNQANLEINKTPNNQFENSR